MPGSTQGGGPGRALDLDRSRPRATDGHVLRSSLIAAMLADELACTSSAGHLYYTNLVLWIGCHADSHEFSRWFGDDLAMRRGSYPRLVRLPYLIYSSAARVRTSRCWRTRLVLTLLLTPRARMAALIHSHCQRGLRPSGSASTGRWGGAVGLRLRTMGRRRSPSGRRRLSSSRWPPGSSSSPRRARCTSARTATSGRWRWPARAAAEFDPTLVEALLRCRSRINALPDQDVWSRALELAPDRDLMLVSVGRGPVCEGLGLEEVGIEYDRRKGIAADEHRRTTLPHVYAVGDCAGYWQLAHTAFREGEVAAENACGHDATVENRGVPRPIYTDPEIAAVGLTEAEAREQYGDDVEVGTFPWVANARAVMQNETVGWVKSIHESRYGELLGLVMVGPHVTDMIEAGVVALDSEATVETVADGMAPHPTLSEAIKEGGPRRPRTGDPRAEPQEEGREDVARAPVNENPGTGGCTCRRDTPDRSPDRPQPHARAALPRHSVTSTARPRPAAQPAGGRGRDPDDFLNAYRALMPAGAPGAANWLLAIVHNVVWMRHRTLSRRPREVPLDEGHEKPRPEVPVELEPELEAFARLPYNQRASIVIREVEGRTVPGDRRGARRHGVRGRGADLPGPAEPARRAGGVRAARPGAAPGLARRVLGRRRCGRGCGLRHRPQGRRGDRRGRGRRRHRAPGGRPRAGEPRLALGPRHVSLGGRRNREQRGRRGGVDPCRRRSRRTPCALAAVRLRCCGPGSEAAARPDPLHDLRPARREPDARPAQGRCAAAAQALVADAHADADADADSDSAAAQPEPADEADVAALADARDDDSGAARRPGRADPGPGLDAAAARASDGACGRPAAGRAAVVDPERAAGLGPERAAGAEPDRAHSGPSDVAVSRAQATDGAGIHWS